MIRKFQFYELSWAISWSLTFTEILCRNLKSWPRPRVSLCTWGLPRKSGGIKQENMWVFPKLVWHYLTWGVFWHLQRFWIWLPSVGQCGSTTNKSVFHAVRNAPNCRVMCCNSHWSWRGLWNTSKRVENHANVRSCDPATLEFEYQSLAAQYLFDASFCFVMFTTLTIEAFMAYILIDPNKVRIYWRCHDM